MKEWRLRMAHISLSSCQLKAVCSHSSCFQLLFNSYSASHDNWCTVRGNGGCRVGEVRAGTTSPCPTIRVLCYSNCQRSTNSHHQQFKGYVSNDSFSAFSLFAYQHNGVKVWAQSIMYFGLSTLDKKLRVLIFIAKTSQLYDLILSSSFQGS